MTTTYPIPVERFKGDQSMTIVCEDCHAEAVASDPNNDALFGCPRRCGGMATYKYEETPRCRGCREFATDFLVFEKNDGCCSRPCRLQADYLAGLKAIRTVAV